MSANTLHSWITRGGGRSDRASRLLAALAFAAAAVVLLLTLGVSSGLADRTARTSWTLPQASERPVATQVSTTRHLGDRPVTVIHLAPEAQGKHGPLPAPPGLSSFPEAGSTYTSPALQEALDDPTLRSAAPDLAEADGKVGQEGLTGPDQLLAVVGHEAGAPAVTRPDMHNLVRPDDHAGPTGVADFSGRTLSKDSEPKQYAWLTLVASLLLTVPVLSLAGAAARLTAGRRTRRLALLRLAGVSRKTLRWLTCREAATTALLGTAGGALAYVALLPLARHIPMVGTSWYLGDLWVGLPLVLAVIALLTGIAVTSALVPLGTVLRDPLAVADRQTPTLPGWWRLAITLAVGGVFARLATREETGPLVVLVALGALFAVMNILGPLVIAVIGRIMVTRARTGHRLVAARRLLDDPRAAWRSVSAITLTAFIAGFLSLFSVGASEPFRGDAHTLDVAVASSSVEHDAEMVREELDRRDIGGSVSISTDSGGSLDTVVSPEHDTAWLAVTLPGSPDLDAQVRGAVAATLPSAPQSSGLDAMRLENRYAEDFSTATIVILAVSFGVAAIATAIMAAAAVLDRRETYRRLWRAGTPLTLLDRARVGEATIPVLLCAGLAATTGLLAAMPLTLSSGGLSSGGLLLLLLTLGVGVLAMRAGIRASRPLLTTVCQS